jgi:hypothetical protein
MQVLELYDSGLSIAKISKMVGLSPYKIKKLLTESGREIRQGNYQDLGITAKANELYKSGLSTYEIAKVLGCSDETVRRKITAIRPESVRNTRSKKSRNKISRSCAEKWKDDEYIAKVRASTSTLEYKAALSKAAKMHLNLAEWSKSDTGRAAVSERAKRLWSDPEYYAKQSQYFADRAVSLSEGSKRTFADPQKRAAWIAKIRASNVKNRANQPRISSTQAQLYYILENSGIRYYEEGDDTIISPFYIVDCIIPKQQDMERDLIIEVQGEYWHSLDRVKLKDRQKKTYIERHTDSDLLCLLELDMCCWLEVASKLESFGLKLCTVKCDVDNLTVARIDEHDIRLFYSIFHYANSVRKGATSFGAYLGDMLVAAISYTYPIRKEVAIFQGLSGGEVIEISRLARITNIDCSNLLSWLIGKTRRMLPDSVKAIVSFSDSTQGHTGGVYRACGFENNGIVSKDYHYESASGRYHKKTIWDMSKKFKMSERDYANLHGLYRVLDDEKTRWIYRI